MWFLCVTSFNHWLLIVNASFNFLIYCSVGTNFKEVIVASRDELYKNRSSQKIDSQRLFSGEYDFPRTFSLTENQFSRKTYFYTIASRKTPAGDAGSSSREERAADDDAGEDDPFRFA